MNTETNMNTPFKGDKEMNRPQIKAPWLGTLLATIGLMALANVSNASSTDTFNASIDSAVWTTSISPTGNPGVGTVTWDSGHVDITQSTNLYANIRESIGPGVKSVSADINNVSDAGRSWAPAMDLYFDPNNWLEFGVLNSLGQFQMQNDFGGVGGFNGVGGEAADTWYTVEIKLNPSTGMAEFYHGPQGGPLTHDSSLDIAVPSSFFTDNAYLILGKGYSNPPTNTFFDNDFSDPGTAGGVSLIDNAIVVTPEPASLSLLVASGVILLGKRQSRARC